MTDVVFLLLDRGANPNARDKAGNTLLLVNSGLYDSRLIAHYLLAKGADVNAHDSEGNTALMRAAMGLDTGLVKLLLDHRADVNAKRRDGRTALSMAAETGRGPRFSERRERVKALLKEAASANDAKKAKQP